MIRFQPLLERTFGRALDVALILRATVAASLQRIFRSEYGSTLLVVGACASILTATRLGHYLNDALFVVPFAIVRDNLEAGPSAPESLRLVLMDDRSIQKLARAPTLAEWLGVAELLSKSGIRRVLILDFPLFSAEVGVAPPRSERSSDVFIGTVSTQKSGHTGARSFQDVLEVQSENSFPGSAAEKRHLVGPPRDVLALVDGIGDLTIEDGNLMLPVVGDEHARIPNLAFRVAAKLEMEADQLVVNGRKVPKSVDGKLHVDFLAYREISARAVPASAFFSDDGSVAGKLNEKVSAKLNGGRVALIVPRAGTGQRFVDSPLGKVPSFLTVTSLAAGILEGRLRFVPIGFGGQIWILFGLAVLASGASRIRVVIGLHLSAATIIVAAGALLLHLVGAILPIGPLVALTLASLAHRILRFSFHSAMERARIQHQVEVGDTVQRHCLPNVTEGRCGPWRYQFTFRPYGPMSGDWFQAYVTPAGASKSFGILAIGDVVGKGPSAALVTAVIAAQWRQSEAQWDGSDAAAARFCADLDRTIRTTFSGAQNTTMSLTILAEDGATCFRFGTSQWLLLKASGESSTIRSRASDCLGASAGRPSVAGSKCSAEPGDWLLAYTDGVIDGGSALMKFRSLLKNTDLQSDSGFASLPRIAREAGEKTALPDDFTMLVIRREENTAKAREPEGSGRDSEG